MANRILVFGDIHGEFDLFQKALASLNYSPEDDVIISVGDLIDRGPKSYETLCWFLTKPNVYSILGNHEHMMITGGKMTHIMNGGSWLYELDKDTRDYLIDSVNKKFPEVLSVQFGDDLYGFVHAEVPYMCQDWEDMANVPTDLMIWSRDFIKYSERKAYKERAVVSGVSAVFHGHTILDEPMIIGNRYYIDTGANYHKRLTVAIIDDSGIELETFSC